MIVQKPCGLRAVALGCLLLAIVTITGGQASADTCGSAPNSLGKFETASDGATVPGEPFLDGDGNGRTLADESGYGLVVNFWATWCPPCVKEMPALDQLGAELDEAEIKVMAVSEDFKGAEAVREFYDRNAIENLEVLVDTHGRLAKAFGVQGLPSTILIDHTGREVGRVTGIAAWDDPATVRFLTDCLGPGD
ncbi:MAG: TlpA family protein disulfide reductase [Rhodospirillales bacterium]|nr:TlpA family protein disulfide reductase [Rhodospirillales bacterium]